MSDSFQRVRQILWEHWDPIGIHDLEEAPKDEYDSYVPKVVALISDPNATQAIAEYLCYVETDRMGGVADPQRARKVAEMCAPLSLEERS